MRAKSGLVTLVLNGDFLPITIVSARRALILLLANKAECLDQDYDNVFHSAATVYPAPVTIRLLKYIKIPYNNTVGLTRKAVFTRDGGKCVYCGTPQDLTLDHVIPKVLKGTHTWENVVTACRKDNNFKGSKTLEELGWSLAVVPKAPEGVAWRVVGHRAIDERWLTWLNY